MSRGGGVVVRVSTWLVPTKDPVLLAQTSMYLTFYRRVVLLLCFW